MDILERFKEIISVSKRPIVFEFGACDGYHSNIMMNILREKNKEFVYHTFEPNEKLKDSILINTKNHLGLFNLYTNAVGAIDELSADFFVSGGVKLENGKVVDNYYGSSSIRKPKLVKEAWKDMTFVKSKTNIITLDTHVKNVGLNNEKIDFIWADIQGAEIDLINGGVDTFKNVKYFYTEYNYSELYEGTVGLEEICKALDYFEIIEDYHGDVLLRNKKF